MWLSFWASWLVRRMEVRGFSQRENVLGEVLLWLVNALCGTSHPIGRNFNQQCSKFQF